MSTTLFIFAILAYLCGSVPTSVWAGKLIYGVDVRKEGSCNPGATNTLRVLGPALAIPVLLLDIFKGWLAVYLASFVELKGVFAGAEVQVQLAFGLLAVLGHLYPVFASFKGGKGVATLLGVGIGIHAPSALLVLALFIVVVLISKYVSLASILSILAYPFVLLFIFNFSETFYVVFTIIVALIVIYTHRSNIQRLLKGRESKISFIKKSS